VIRPRHIALFVSGLLASCASDKSPDSSGYRPFSQRLNEQSGYKQDADGNWTAQSDRRSSFESKGDSPYFSGDYQKKSYQTSEVAKKSWWGKNEYARKSYAGNTDAGHLKTSSRHQGQGALEAGNDARLPQRYETGSYATGAAREASGETLERPSDAETDVRRRVFTPPSVIDWKEQRSLSMEQSRSILGR
jgi:hypothetical protein